MNCEYCGSRLFETDRSCPRCGAGFNFSTSEKTKTFPYLPKTNGVQEITINGFASANAVTLAEKVSAWNGGREVFFIIKKEYLSILWDSRFFSGNQEEYPCYFMNKYKVFIFPENSELDRSYIYIIPTENKNVVGKILV